MNQQIGKGSLCFSEAPFIIGTASVVGTKEGEGPLAEEFDCIGSDDKFGQDTWEAAESSLQQEALTLALGKADKKQPRTFWKAHGCFCFTGSFCHSAKRGRGLSPANRHKKAPEGSFAATRRGKG